MRVAIAALGTRGDVVPYVVLGRGLRAAGHDVLISTMERFRRMVEDAGLGFHALPGDPADASRTVPVNVSLWRPRHHLRAAHGAVAAIVGQTDPAALCERWADRDCVIVTGASLFAIGVAQELGARFVTVVMTPAVATGAFPQPVLLPGLAFGRRGNLASWLALERAAGAPFKEPLKPGVRRSWGLPGPALSADRSRAGWPPFPVVHAVSPAVVAPPADWPRHVSVTGWLLPEVSSQPLAEEVERFLGDGPPPVYVGFGSMPVPDPQGTGRMLVAALRRTGLRAIVCGAALAGAPVLQGDRQVLAVAEVAHERLLHRVRAVVHHGGSGTVGAGLCAGRPTLVVPFIFDQFFWGHRVGRLGVGPAAIPFGRLTEDRLVGALERLTSGRHAAAAERLGERIRTEDPAARAVEAVLRAGGQ